MRLEAGFVNELRHDIASVKPEFKAITARIGGLSNDELISLVNNADQPIVDNCDQPAPGDVTEYTSLKDEQQLAINAIRAGEVAFVVLAAGSGTRAGGPKVFLRMPKLGMSVLADCLTRSSAVTDDGRVLQPHVWFMTSPTLFNEFSRVISAMAPLPEQTVVFEGFESYRLLVNNRIDFNESGVPTMYPTGHGDLGPALLESKVLDDFPNVKYCVVVNSDNVFATLDLKLLGHHIASKKHVTCEVVERLNTDTGGVLAWVDNRLQVVEGFRLPEGFVEEAKFQNTNSMIVTTTALRTPLRWRWYRVRKHVDNRLVVQYERLLQQYTEAFETEFVHVERRQRYLPIKDNHDLLRVDELLNGNK